MRNYTKPLILAVALIGATNFALAQDAAPEEGAPPMVQNEGMMGQDDMSGMMGMMQMMQACTEMMTTMTEQMKAPMAPETPADNG